MESMKDGVKKELDDLKQMVNNWQKCYLSWMEEDGSNEWLIGELSETISISMAPYVARLRVTDSITSEEEQEFWKHISGVVLRFAETVKEEKTCPCGGNHGCEKRNWTGCREA